MNRTVILAGIVITLALFILPVFILNGRSSPTNSGIITQSGIHWHPHLTIFVKGKKVEIPKDVGRTGGTEQPIHMHEEDDFIHLEFSGMVYKSETTLGQFFKVWGKTLTHACLFEFCSGGAGKLSMTVNKQPNTEYENYPMADKDEIVLKFE
ncbi:MAG: hypothetical protein AAB486_04765 [Patescibacteria group bacterium]